MKTLNPAPVLLMVIWAVVSFAVSAAHADTVHTPLPPAQQIVSTLASADQAVALMYITSAIAVDPSLQGKLISAPDFLAVEAQAIHDLIGDHSVPSSQKEIFYVRYTMGDPRIDEALIAAKNAGIAVQIVTDFNTTLAYTFKDGEKITSDFAHATLKDPTAPGGASLARLEKVFKLGSELISQPIYNTKIVDRVPIMHEKALLLRAGNVKTIYAGSANAAPHVRVNRVLKYIDPSLYDAYASHIRGLVANYAQGKETHDLPVEQRTHLTYRDGTSIELAFTNGRFNPNDRAAAVVNTGTLTSFIASEFAPTNRSVIGAIGTTMKSNPKITGLMVTDDTFSTIYGYGVTNALENITVEAPHVPVFGFGEAVAHQIDSFIWQKPAVDANGNQIRQTEEDGEPLDRELWHDKTLLLRTTQPMNADTATYIYTGSFNLSNNVANAENQLEIKVPSKSWLVQAVDFSVRQTVKTFPQWAVPQLPAVLRNSLAHAFKVGTLDISIDLIAKLVRAIDAENSADVRALLIQISDSDTKMTGALSTAERAARANALADFYDWSEQALPKFTSPDLKIKSLLGLVIPIADPTTPIVERVSILKNAVWRPGMTPDDQRKFAVLANDKMGLPAIPPEALKSQAPKAPPAPAPDAKAPARNAAVPASNSQVDVEVFDLDGTILNLDTKIRIFKKNSSQFVDISSHLYARIEGEIGKAGTPYANFETRRPNAQSKDDSFVYFMSNPNGPNYLLNSVETALKGPANRWQAPEFNNFINRLKDPATAARTYILTARAQTPAEFAPAWALISAYVEKTTGVKLGPFDPSHFIGVGYAVDTATEKTVKMLALVKEWQAKGVNSFKFFDDTEANVQAMQTAMAAAHETVDTVHVVRAAKVVPAVIESKVPATAKVLPIIRPPVCRDLLGRARKK